MTTRTLDRAPDFYTVEQVGRTQEITPEGYLLCRDVPIARTGEMLYGPGEIVDVSGKLLEPGKDGIIHVTRGEDEVFRPETIASANGKSITDDHPDEDVSPLNWNELTAGIVLNPRRGDRTEDQFLLADFLITNADAIKAVQGKKREVSCGYDADYEQTAPGQAVQRNIIFNHVALVEHGRCGPRCSIGDHHMPKITVSRPSWKDRVLQAFKAKDEEGLKTALEGAPAADDEPEGGDGETHVHIHLNEAEKPETKDDDPPVEAAPAWFSSYTEKNDARVGAIEEAIKKLAPETTDEKPTEEDGGKTEVTDEELQKEPDGSPVMDEEVVPPDGEKDPLQSKDKKTRDVAFKSDFQDAVSRAEIILPGLRLPTYDAANAAKSICLFRRRVLYRASTNDAAAAFVEAVLGKTPAFKTMTCDAVKVAFNAVAELARSANNTQVRISTYDRSDAGTKKVPTLAEMNERNKAFWAGQSK